MKSLKLAGLIQVAGALLCSGSASAGGLVTPFTMDSAAVMPKGVRSFRIAGLTTQVGEKYDTTGSIVPLAKDFNKQVTLRELVDAQPAGFQRGQLKGGLESMNIPLDAVVGDAHGMVNTAVNTMIPLFAYGITEKLTLGVGVPIIASETSVATGWTANGQFQDTVDFLSAQGFGPKLQQVKGQLDNVVAAKIANYGYEPLVNDKHTDIGDTNLGLKYQVYSDSDLAVAIGPRVVIPTGRRGNVNKVVDIAGGDKQWDAGLSAVVDYNVMSRLTLTGSVGYTHQFESTQAKRIPLSEAESISPDVDRNTNEKLGDIMGASVLAKYKVLSFLTAGAGYSLQYKDADEFSGNAFDSSRYAYLSDETRQNMQAALASLTASTIAAYRTGSFPVPGDLSFSYARVLDGRNVNQIDLFALEFAAYF